MNSIQEKRKKLQEQSSNSVHKNASNNDIVCDDKTLCRTSAEESDEGRINVGDNDIECKDTISSTRDGCCCKDTSFSGTDPEQDLSDSPVPCSDFTTCDNFRRLQSWSAIYPSEEKTILNDSDASLSGAICTNIEQRNYRKSDARNNVCENNSGYIESHAVDDSRWLPKSIYTDCATRGEVPRERFADGCRYRNERPQDSALNRNNVRKGQTDRKLLQRPSESCQKGHVARQRSRCSCITEEEEDCFTVDKVEGKLPENVCNNTKRLEKISVCRAPSNKLIETAALCDIDAVRGRVVQTQTCENIFEDSECLEGKCNNDIKMSVCQTSSKLDKDASVCETVSFSVARDRFEKMRTCKTTLEDSVKRLKGVSTYETTFGNSEELRKVTRVCKEFVTDESPEDITVCKRMFGEPKRPSEEVIVCEALPDAGAAPKETICKKISDPNFVNRNNDKKVLLNDAKDNLVKENTSGSNLNIQRTNGRENAARTVQLDNSVALNDFTRQKSVNNTKQDERIKESPSNNPPRILTAPVGPNKDPFSKPLSKIIHSAALPHAQSYDRSNLASNPNEKKTRGASANKRKMTRMNPSPDQTVRNHFQQLDKNSTAQNSASDKIDEIQSEEEARGKLREEERDTSRERTAGEIPRDSLLNRSVKKLIDVIKLGRMKIKERTETEKDKAEKIISDGIKVVGKSRTVFKNKGKFNDAIESREKKTSEKIMPLGCPLTKENDRLSI